MTPGALTKVTPRELLLLWTHEEIRVVCRRPQDLENYPDLAMRIRGAFGRQLARLGPPVAHRFDPFSRPRAFDVLFGAAPERAGRPMALDADVTGATVTVELRLFGSAMFYAGQCREALLAALAGGVSIRPEGRHHVTFEPLDCLGRRLCPALPPETISGASLTFVTPVAVRSGGALLSTPSALLYASVTRLRGLAPWIGVEISADWRALHACCSGAEVVADTLFAYRSRRFSQRQPDRVIPVLGLLGSCTLRGNLTPLAPFLALAAYTHIGSHAALGLGRLRPAVWP